MCFRYWCGIGKLILNPNLILDLILNPNLDLNLNPNPNLDLDLIVFQFTDSERNV
jgi:hypothetical protein